jgi:DNA-binding HxlR family transcriptional regulator
LKGKRTSLDGNDCAIARSLGDVGDWWSLLIVRDALAGKRRFGEFQASLGLAKNILSARLQKLVERGILTTAPASDGTAYREYVLTPKGEKLFVVITALWQWGEEFCFERGELSYDMVDRKTHETLQPLQVKSRRGRVLGAADIQPLAKAASAKKPATR